MRNRYLLLVLALGLGLVFSGQPRQAVQAGGDQTDRVEQLIKQLGSPKFTVRDRAKKELEAMGPAALAALRKAAKSDDMEPARRAGELVKKLEDKLTLDNQLAPKKVHLKLKDVSVLAAVEELSKQSGYPINIDGDRTGLAQRKITLDTGETTFWQAFDQVCQKGGLAEVAPAYNPNPYGRPGIGIQPVPIQIQPLPVNPPVQIQPRLQPKPLILPNIQNGPNKEALERLQKALEQLQKQLEKDGNKLPPLQLPNFQPGQLKPGIQLQPLQPNQEMQKELQKLLEKMMEQMQKENPNLPPLKLPAFRGALNADGFQNVQVVAPAPNQAQGGVGGQAQAGKAAKGVMVKVNQAIQAQPVQAQPAIQIGGKRQPIRAVNPNGPLTVQDGAAQVYPTSYAGAVRIRVLPLSTQPNAPKREGEILVLLEATGEPRMQNFGVVGSAMIDKALDDAGQALFVVMDQVVDNNDFNVPNGIRGRVIVNGQVYNPYGTGIHRHALVRLKVGEKQSKSLKELTGNLTTQMLSPPEALITFDNLMKAAGKEGKGPNGSRVEVVNVTKQDNGDVRVQVRMEYPQNVGAQQMPQINATNGFRTNFGVATVRDAKGKEYQFVTQQYVSSRFVNGAITQEVALTYRPNGAGEATILSFNGYRMITMQVPFTFKDLPLQ